eukprot:1138301-Pelagomonas_calceolata.AAC.5
MEALGRPTESEVVSAYVIVHFILSQRGDGGIQMGHHALGGWGSRIASEIETLCFPSLCACPAGEDWSLGGRLGSARCAHAKRATSTSRSHCF